MRNLLSHAMRQIPFLFFFLTVLVFQPQPALSLILQILTSDGDSLFYAPPGDTVDVVVEVDSEGEVLTGVELFLAFDPGLFEPLDISPDPGIQPAESDGLLSEILVDTLLAHSDSLVIVHYAEADLSGAVVSGPLFTLRLVVTAGLSGSSQIALHNDPGIPRVSVYTVPNVDGLTFEFEGVPPLEFRNLPPSFQLPDPFQMDEDSVLVLNLLDLATDAESGPAGIVWDVTGSGSNVDVTFPGADSTQVVFTPSPDFNGDVQIAFSATDPSGISATAEVPLAVQPVNDPPQIVGGVLQDTISLSGPSVSISLAAGGEDVDDDLGSLVWQGLTDGSVNVEILEGPTARIFADLDWAGSETIQIKLMDPSGAFDQVSISVIREVPIQALAGDFDGDGEVGFQDFLEFVLNFERPDADPQFDLDGDGRVGLFDFIEFAQNFGKKLT